MQSKWKIFKSFFTINFFYRMVIRIRYDADNILVKMGNKFGCDPKTDAPHLLNLAKMLNIDVIGVSFHVGSGCEEPIAYRNAIAAAREVFDLAENLGFKFKLLDVGGGYPGYHGESIDEVLSQKFSYKVVHSKCFVCFL